MNCDKTAKKIAEWMNDQLMASDFEGFVVGISGGVDSAVVSALCGISGKETLAIRMPIYQKLEEITRASEQYEYLLNTFEIESRIVELSATFNAYKTALVDCNDNELAMANLKSRIRMSVLYAYATTYRFLVVGTGNLIEDIGVGFFTKWGDGGVDISPIGSLTKTQVYELASYFNIPESIQKAAPTDGLWNDGRTDESQLGCTYKELEKAMEFAEQNNLKSEEDVQRFSMTDRQTAVLINYIRRHKASAHKMSMPPIGPEPIM